MRKAQEIRVLALRPEIRVLNKEIRVLDKEREIRSPAKDGVCYRHLVGLQYPPKSDREDLADGRPVARWTLGVCKDVGLNFSRIDFGSL